MGNGFQFIDIIFFAMIAAFLVLRLRGVLGKRDGHEGSFQDMFKRNAQDKNKKPSDKTENTGNVVPLNSKLDIDPEENDDMPEAQESDVHWPDQELAIGMTDISEADPAFNPNEFIDGASGAFEIILAAFADGNKEELRGLLSDEVYNNFLMSIEARENAGHKMEDSLVSIKAVEPVEAYMEGSTANITIKFISEQVNVIYDENEDVVEGNENLVAEVTDFWTFARDTDSNDPNWNLVATRSLD